MNKKEQQALRAKQEDAVLNKVLVWIVGAVVLEFLLLLLNKFYSHYTPEQIPLALALRGVFQVLAIVLPICFVILLVWTILSRRAGKVSRLPVVLTTLSLVLAVCAIVIRLFAESGIQLLYVAVPSVAALALIFYLYQREFFFSAVLCALGLLGVKVVPYTSFPVVCYGYAVALAVILVVAAVCFRLLQTGGGNLKLGGRNVSLLPKNANYILLYVTCALVALVVIAALLLGGLAVLYGVLVAWLLILAVYHTVRLM